MRHKVTVVGAGNVGATCAQELARRDYAEVVLVDIKEGLPQGKALDINEAAPVLRYEPALVGSNPSTGPIWLMSSAFPCGRFSTMSTRTTSQ